jgi:hypothetical protein
MDHNLELFDSRESAFEGRGGVYASAVAPQIEQWIAKVLAGMCFRRVRNVQE